jgi:hypothetical protein
MNEPPVVDLIPPEPPDILPPPQQQSQLPPIPMPSQTSPPPFNAPAKQFAKQGLPVTQETFTKQTIYSGNGGGPGIAGGDVGLPPGTSNKAKTMIEYLNSLHFDPNCQSWAVQVDRLGPPRYEGHILVTGPIEQISPPIPYRDVIERVRDLHGGGKYTIKIVNDVGQMVGHIPLNIEMINCPPVVRGINGAPPVQTGYRSIGGGGFNAGAMGAGFAGGDDELGKIRQAEAVARAQKSLRVAEFDSEETQRTIEKRRRSEIEADERRKGTPEVESLRASIVEMNHANELRLREMQSSFEKNLLMLAGAQKKDDSQPLMMLIVEMMKSTQQTMVAFMSNNKDKGPDQMAEIIKMTSAANDKVVQMALAGSSKNDKLLESLILSKIEHPETAVKQALELRESGFKQAMQMHEMFEERRGEPDEVINPESGFWGNLGNVILSSLQGAFSGGAKGAGKQFVEAAAQLLQKPANTPPQNFSPQDLQTLTNIMVQQQKQNAAAGFPVVNPLTTPPPRQVAALPAPAQQQPRPIRRLDPYKIFDRVYEVEAAAPQISQPWVPQASQVVPMQQSPVVEEVEEVAQQVPMPQVEDSGGGVSLQDYVNEAVQLMLVDLKRNVREHDWVDCAISKWDEDFLQAIAGAPDDTARIELIRNNADPVLFDQVTAILLSNHVAYERFVQNMEDFVHEIKDPEKSGATS